MNITVRKYTENDVKRMTEIWNEVVAQGDAFPQENYLSDDAYLFFSSQTYCGVAVDNESNEILGLYILHPNNIGRCGHISNASYAVASDFRNMHIGQKLVSDCINIAPLYGFRILQFNAVVSTNTAARHLYEKLGFIGLGTIKNGFRMNDGTYKDICPYYIQLK